MVAAVLLASVVPSAGQVRFGEPERVFVVLSESPRAQAMIDEFEQLAAQGRNVQAVGTLQRAIDSFPHHPIRTGPGQHADLIRWAHDRIASDAGLAEAYRAAIGPEAERRRVDALKKLDRAALQRIGVRFASAPASIDAELDAAAIDLERARSDLAAHRLSRLEEDPRLGDRRARWHRLTATAALYRGDQRTYERTLSQLAEGQRRDVERLARSIRLPKPAPSPEPAPPVANRLRATKRSPVDRFDVSGQVGRKRMELDRTWGMLPWGLEVAMWDPLPSLDNVSPTSIPIAAGSIVYINTGRSIRAMDPADLSVRWSRTFEDDELVAAAKAQKRRVVGWHVTDPRGVALDGGVAFGVIGRLIGRPLGAEDPKQRFGFSLLAAVDAASGAVRWRKRPVQWAAELNDVALHGTPIVIDGRVIVLGHEIADGVHQTTHAVCVDAATGELIWRRRIAIVQEQIRGSIASHAAMLVHDHRLYIADGLGFATRLDPWTGVADWTVELLAQPDEEGRTLERARAAFERRIGPPAIVDAGLIIPMRLASVGAVRLDPKTGRRLGNLADEWTGVNRVVTIGRDVLAVGRTSAMRCDGRTLIPKWKAALTASRREPPAQPPPFRGFRSRREATLPVQPAPGQTGSQLLVPHASGDVTVIDLATGRIDAQIKPPAPGQIVPMGRSLISVGIDRAVRLDPIGD